MPANKSQIGHSHRRRRCLERARWHGCEQLEPRWLLTTYTVTTTTPTGAGSIIQAINDANAHVGADTIAFNIPGAGVHHIITALFSSELPTITDTVTIDGTTQPGYV